MRFPEPPRSWADGSEVTERQLVTLIKVSVGGAARDLFGSQREIGREVIAALIIVTAVFSAIYLVAVSFAVVMIVAITRATARLSRGAREVGGGNLDWRIPVKKRDQLGDLALSFNAMSESVKHMLVEVAEKERPPGRWSSPARSRRACCPAGSSTTGASPSTPTSGPPPRSAATTSTSSRSPATV